MKLRKNDAALNYRTFLNDFGYEKVCLGMYFII